MMPCEIIEPVYISLSIVYLYLFNLLLFFLLSYSRLLLWHSSQILYLFFIVFKLKLLAIFIYKLTKTLNFSRNDDLNYLCDVDVNDLHDRVDSLHLVWRISYFLLNFLTFLRQLFVLLPLFYLIFSK